MQQRKSKKMQITTEKLKKIHKTLASANFKTNTKHMLFARSNGNVSSAAASSSSAAVALTKSIENAKNTKSNQI